MSLRDVVIVVEPRVQRDELQYALRSLDMIPHGRVFMVGGRPPWVQNVYHVPYKVTEKWTALTNVWRDVIPTLNLTGEFIYTEDDYFILDPVDDIPNYHSPKTLRERCQSDSKGNGGWGKSMKNTLALLEANGYDDPLSFDVHIPMVVERDRIPTWDLTEPWLRYRSLIGNTATRPAVPIRRDVKVGTLKAAKDVRPLGFLSSSDRTFHESAKLILRDIFPERCRYEKEPDAMQFDGPASPYDETPTIRQERLRAKKQRILAHRVRRDGRVQAQVESGGWVDVEHQNDAEFDERAALEAATVAHLRTVAADLNVDYAGLRKADLVDAILEAKEG